MRFMIFSLSFFLLSFQTHATCSQDKQVPGKHLVITRGEVSVVQGLSLKTNNPWKKLSSNKRNTISSFSKTFAKDTLYSVEGMRESDLEKLDYVKSVQPDCFVEVSSNDALVNFQSWYLSQVDFEDTSVAPKREIIVAVSDTGVDIDHNDLKNNLWVNTLELNGTAGVDDDNNGYVDDINGYDFADNDNDPRPSITNNDVDHGTHVSGLVGARYNNNIGVTGVSKNNVKIMPLKGFASNGRTTLGDLLETIYYAVDNGAHIINASWGVEKTPQGAEVAAVNYATQNGVVIVAAAGNDNIPASWVVPANIQNVITVAALNSADQLSTFTNYEDSNNIVDFVAPGGDGSSRRNEALLSTGNDGTYVSLRGTSMAAPLVSGAIGFIMSQSTSISAFQAVFVLSNSSDNLNLSPYLQSKTDLYQKINIQNALDYLQANENSIPSIDPELSPVSELGTRDLASLNSSSGSGCSGSLEPSSESLDIAKLPLILFFQLPLIFLFILRRKFQINNT